MKSKKIFLYVGLLAAGFALALGCNKEEMQGAITGSTLKVYNIINSGCLSNVERGEAGSVSPLYHEKLRLKALVDGRLQITHDSVTYNCAAKIEIHAHQENNQISVIEKDIADNKVRCFCPYNLQYEIPLSYGTYTIRINEGDVYTFIYHATTDTVIVLNKHPKYL